VATDSAGALAETLDYFPFGKIRIDNRVGTFDEQRKYIGQEFDSDTGLNYLNARYYNPSIGRFISEDPVFWAIPAETRNS
jgi:RHS repeat-associated protein